MNMSQYHCTLEAHTTQYRYSNSNNKRQ